MKGKALTGVDLFSAVYEEVDASRSFELLIPGCNVGIVQCRKQAFSHFSNLRCWSQASQSSLGRASLNRQNGSSLGRLERSRACDASRRSNAASFHFCEEQRRAGVRLARDFDIRRWCSCSQECINAS